MKFLGNIIWLIFGGLETALEYIGAGLVMCITIIGIPWGIQAIKMGLLCLWPFGKEIVTEPDSGCLNTVMNIIWFAVGGIWFSLTHLLFGVVLYVTIIGIPWGKQHFKLMHIAFTPFGRTVV